MGCAWLVPVLATGIVATQAMAAPKVAFEVPMQYRLIDGIATDGSTFWLSSVKDRVIIERKGEKFRAFSLPPDAGRPRGIVFDQARNLVWIATDCPTDADAGPCTTGGLIAMDRNGNIKKRLVPANGKSADFDQVNVTSYYDVYKTGDQITEQLTITDVRTGTLYACLDECTRLDDLATLIAAGKMRNLTDNGSIATNAARAGAESDIAGLANVGSYFVATQRLGARGGRVVAFQRVRGGIVNAKLLADSSIAPEPGQVAGFGTRAWFVADSQWSSYTSATSQPQRPTPIVMVSVAQ